jgi:hypothetical protein
MSKASDPERQFRRWCSFTSARGRGCAKKPVKDSATLVVLEERGLHGALLDAVAAGRKGRAYMIMLCFF